MHPQPEMAKEPFINPNLLLLTHQLLLETQAPSILAENCKKVIGLRDLQILSVIQARKRNRKHICMKNCRNPK